MLLISGTFFLPHSPKKWEHWLGKRTVSGSEGFLNFWFMTPQRVTSYANGVTGNYLLIYWFTDVGHVIPNEPDHGLEQAESLSILLEDPKARRILDTFQALNVLRVLRLKDFTQSWEHMEIKITNHTVIEVLEIISRSVWYQYRLHSYLIVGFLCSIQIGLVVFVVF